MYKGIIIFGTMGAGKDALGDEILRQLGNATKVKLGAYIRTLGDLYGGTRKTYQAIGQGLREVVDIDFWNTLTCNHIQNQGLETMDIIPVICDGRQLNEHTYWKDKGYLTVGITAPLGVRLDRHKRRDGYEPPMDAMVHDTELQAQFVATQLCDIDVCNAYNCIENLAPMAAYIVSKFYKG